MDNNPAKYTQATHAMFEDFLEAVCRMADMKALPEFGMDVVEYYRVTTLADRRTLAFCERC
jgi:hypothetical protein